MKRKNNIYTLSYFKKRLKDNGYTIWSIFNKYGESDPRYWTVLLNPSVDSVYVTCYLNKEELYGQPEFELNDGGRNFQKNLTIQTSSMEIIIDFLMTKGIVPDTSIYCENT